MTSTSTTAADAPHSAQGAKGLEELHRRANQVRRERQRHSREEDQGSGEKKPAPPAHSGKAAQVEVREHHDSGGGAAQFRAKGGDNSIQEFGEEGAAAQRGPAAAALHAFLDARAARRWSEACYYLSAGLVASLEELNSRYASQKELDGCPEILSALGNGATESALRNSAEVDVASLRMDGETGFLIYSNAQGDPYAMPMVREDREWKVGGLEGSPLP